VADDDRLIDIGLDSLMAVELMNRLESELHLSIPMGSVLSGPNVRQLASTLLSLVLDKAKIKKEFAIEIPYWRDSVKLCIQRLK